MNPITGKHISNAITKMTKADALRPIVALEAVVVTGRTYQAYKRGKGDEARERFIEETMGSIVWLCGVKYLNKLGDKIVAQILKSQGKNFDVGTDKLLRTPFDNFMKKVAPRNFTPNQVALIKGGKVLTSIVLANMFIGLVVPKLNQALTRKVIGDRKAAKRPQKQNNPTFKGGGIASINKFTNWIENTNTGQLLSSDVGVAGGRMYSARRKEERREIAIRDIGSIYFYMWAQGHVRNLLNLAETGRATRLNPATAEILHKHLTEFIGDKDMNVNEFKKQVLGLENPEIKYNPALDNLFEKGELSNWAKFRKKQPLEVAKVADIEASSLIKEPEILNRLKEMSKLQPLRRGEAVVTKQQFLDALNKSEINNPKLLDEVFTEFTGGANKDEFKYISNNKLYKLKDEMKHYVETICKAAKGRNVNKKLLQNVKIKNTAYSGINFLAGFAVAATFLSTIIPKIQYWYTRKTTGVNAFPGVYDFEKHKEA